MNCRKMRSFHCFHLIGCIQGVSSKNKLVGVEILQFYWNIYLMNSIRRQTTLKLSFFSIHSGRFDYDQIEHDLGASKMI